MTLLFRKELSFSRNSDPKSVWELFSEAFIEWGAQMPVFRERGTAFLGVAPACKLKNAGGHVNFLFGDHCISRETPLLVLLLCTLCHQRPRALHLRGTSALMLVNIQIEFAGSSLTPGSPLVFCFPGSLAQIFTSNAAEAPPIATPRKVKSAVRRAP